MRESFRRTVMALAVGLALVPTAARCGSSTSASSSEPAYARILRPELEAIVKEGAIPGAVVVVRSPTLGNWSAAFGIRRLGGTQPIGVDDYFRIASNTKTMTGTVILQLVQEGKLRLDDPVSKYIPDVPNGWNITIAELLSMRSGLFDYLSSPQWLEAEDKDHERIWTPSELLALAFAHPPEYPPGQGFNYSNTNTVLLGLIIEKLTGQSLGTVLEARIFRPLGLTHTYLPNRSSSAIAEPHPQGYYFGTFADSATSGGVLPPDRQEAARAGTLRPNDVTDVNPSWAWAAGAVISTPSDLARYVKALVGGGLLDPQMQRERLDSLRTVPHSPNRYGYALLTLGPLIGHTGDFPGFNSVMYYDPKRQLAIVAYTTLNNTPDGRLGAEELMKALFAQFYPGMPFPGSEGPP
jgi:CubicO group peptidase (beta-lactamase class C family)